MKQTFLSKTGLSFFLLVILLNPVSVHAQWTHDAYINDFRVNDDATMQEQRYSKIGVDSGGNFVVAWNDDRNFTNNSWHHVYCQIFDKWGNRIGNNFRIGQDTTFIYDLVVLQNGRFIAFWIHSYYFDRYELCFQRFDQNGNPVSNVKRVIDTSFSQSAQSFSGGGIGVDSIGKFVVCWARTLSISPPRSKVFVQRFDSSGNHLGITDTVNNSSSSITPRITVNRNGAFVVCWETRNDIYMQRYNSNGQKIGINIKVNDDTDSTIDQSQPSVSTDGKGNFAICWIDGRIMFEHNVFYQLYDTNANPIGPNKLASSTTSGFTVSSPVCAMRSDRYFFIGWSDATSGPRKFLGRRFNSSGDPYGNPSAPYAIPVNSTGEEQCDDAFILGDRVYASWYDNRLGNFDIFCNVRGFQNPDTVLGISAANNSVNTFELYPAYPNPFNPFTRIQYQISYDDFVKLLIYDITGKQISILVNQNQKRGIYEITFNGSQLSSGIFFIHLYTGTAQSKVQKIILLK